MAHGHRRLTALRCKLVETRWHQISIFGCHLSDRQEVRRSEFSVVFHEVLEGLLAYVLWHIRIN